MLIPHLHELFLKSTGVCTDTRKVRPGELFFALKGPNFNGNLFAGQALAAGAEYVIVDEASGTPDSRTVVVGDVLTSLQDLARFHRLLFEIPVIAITGSNGKTTNKELISSVLSRKFRTLSTKGNLNNHIGVPLTLLELKEEHEIAIIEMGANHIGEIGELCNIARPGFGLITSIGEAHLEGFGSIEGVRTAKRQLFDYIVENGGKCFVNLGMEHVPDLYDGPEDRAVFYGTGGNPPYTESILQSPRVEARFRVNGHSATIRSGLIGAFQAANMLNAFVIGRYFGVGEGEIIGALESYRPSNNRAELVEYRDNSVILDAYNANPSSMKAALDALARTEGRPRMAVLGDMFELGSESIRYHQEIVDLVDSEDIDTVVLVGKDFSRTRIPAKMYHFDTTAEAREWWKDQDIRGYTILIKGSRGVHLEVLLKD